MNRDSPSTVRGGLLGRRLAVGFAFGLLLLISVGTATPAGAATGVTLTGRINGQSLATSSQSNPVRLYPLRPATIAVTIQNNSSATVHVATVRLAGVVIGLTFFAFDNSVAFAVPPHTTVTNRYSIPLVGLNGQATGLIQGSLSVLDPGQQVVASQGMVVDVRGSLGSVYGVFGLVVALLTLLALLLVLLELARHRLHSNRFRRGLYFVVPGLGIGLVLVFTLSASRVFVPSVSHWVPLIVFSAVILFVVGFLTPDPGIDDDDEDVSLAPAGAAAAGSTPATPPGSTATPAPATPSPKAGGPKTAGPSTGAPKTTGPSTGAPKTGSPSTGAPKTTGPPTGAPKTAGPAGESPATAPGDRKPAPPTVAAPNPSAKPGPSAASRDTPSPGPAKHPDP